MGKGTGTQHCKGISISEGTTQRFTGGKTYSSALQPLSAALLTNSALRKANLSCPSSPAAPEGGHALNILSTHPPKDVSQEQTPKLGKPQLGPCCKLSALSL